MSDRLVRKKTPAPSREQIRNIKRIMLWPRDKRFPRCPAKNKAFMKQHEETGDFSHSDLSHLCDECRCKHRAGQGTHGDFYGLGIETGHLGVGWCYDHDFDHPTWQIIEYCDNQLRLIQQVGDTKMDSLSHEKNAKENARIASLSLKGRQDLELVVETLIQFKEDLGMMEKEETESVPLLREIVAKLSAMSLENKASDSDLSELRIMYGHAFLERTELTEMTKSGPVPMTDATQIKLKLEVAKALSKVKLDHFKLDSTSYLHYDELKVRIPRMMNLAQNLFEELKEKVMNNEENAVDQINEKWTKGLTTIWSDVKTGAQA